jgi:serine/threonine protein phosphatase 1
MANPARGATVFLPFRLLRAFQRKPKAISISTEGRLIYAIGDVHGRLDLLEKLVEQIRADAAAGAERAPGAQAGADPRPVMVFVGDYVDRGADSKGVIDKVISLKAEGDFELCTLKGNHEEALLAFLADPNFGPTWTGHGGAETLSSYGVTPPILRSDADAWNKACEAFGKALPKSHADFLGRLELTASYGDYVFVHAGLRPGVPLAEQSEHDLLWIRYDFLNASRPFEKIVVHGHTPAEEPYMGERRIGIDTGAYATGVLTAVRLEGADRRLIQARSRGAQ